MKWIWKTKWLDSEYSLGNYLNSGEVHGFEVFQISPTAASEEYNPGYLVVLRRPLE